MRIDASKAESFTDKSGKFHVGMTKEEASQLKKSIWIDYEKEFDRVDKDQNGVLDAKEISAEIKNDAANTWDNFKSDSLWFGACAALTIFTKSFNTAFMKGFTLYYGVKGVVDGLNNRKLRKQAEALDELIKKQETEKVSA